MLNLELLPITNEVAAGLATKESLSSLVKEGRSVIFKSNKSPVVIGEGSLVKVNVNLGISLAAEEAAGLATLGALTDVVYRPDVMMDHTIVEMPGKQFYQYLVESFPGPVGTLPHYLSYSPTNGIEPQKLLEIAQAQAEAGVSFMTLHPTATRELFEIAKRDRALPTTSRGGGLVLKDLYLKNHSENVLLRYFPELLSLLLRHGMGLSIGSVFRPANIGEAMDTVHVKETEYQLQFIREAQRVGVPVQMEGIGHITLSRLPRYLELIKEYKVPLMPLGPIPTDAGIGEDHITNAIGAAYAAMLGGVHAINSITREEHTGGVPTTASILEGLRAARLAAHIVNLNRFPKTAVFDAAISDARAEGRTCVVGGGLFGCVVNNRKQEGCTRCREECPLVIGARV